MVINLIRIRFAAIILFVLGAVLPAPVWAQDVSDLYEQVNGSVVVIRTKGKDVNPRAPGKLTSIGGLGSGVLISADGKILTAAHVVQIADEIEVEFLNGTVIAARVVASDTTADLALVQLEDRPTGIPVANLGDSDSVSVGDPIFIIGAPYGIDHTLTVGHVSGRRRPQIIAQGMAPVEFFQTDAAVNRGNSGGPMFNMNGEVIGIVSYIITQSGGFEGIGFAGTSNMARRILLESAGFWSGIDGFLLTGPLAKILNVPQWGGFLVQRVAENSPAARLGLRGGTLSMKIEDLSLIVGGDIILEGMGIPLDRPERIAEIRQKLNEMSPSQILKVKILRGGKVMELTTAWAP